MENEEKKGKKINLDTKTIAQAILVAAVIIAGAIMFNQTKPSGTTWIKPEESSIAITELAPISQEDRTLGNKDAKVAVIMYEDFQCPFCGAIKGENENNPAFKYLKQRDPSWTPFMPTLIEDYVNKGTILLVYRDYPFLGQESYQASEAARCAEDQGKFWEYHDYLYAHQEGENEGAFSIQNLKRFSKDLGLNESAFANCLDSGKYAQAVKDSRDEALGAGVSGTPKGFILKDGKVVNIIDGAVPLSTVKPMLDRALR